MSKTIVTLILLLTWLTVFSSACAPVSEPPVVSEISIQPTTIVVGQAASLVVNAQGRDLAFKWEVRRGKLSDTTKPSVVYTAPPTAGEDTVTVTVTSSGSAMTTKSITFRVVERTDVTTTPRPPDATPARTPSPAATATAGVTATPRPSETTPPQIPSPAATATASGTAAPAASGWKVGLADGQQVPQQLSVMGDYPAEAKEDLWIFVLPLTNRLYYAQSMDACKGEGTPKAGGKWEMHVGFGNASDVGVLYQLVVTTATPEASAFVSNTLKQWCADKYYPGWAALPPGVSEKMRVTVRRSAETWGAAPALPGSRLPGTVTLTNVAPGDKMPPTLLVTGTFAPTTLAEDIWLLVYAQNGKWYPQSTEPCLGLHAKKGNGAWEVLGTFTGVSGEALDIVVVVADARANRYLADTQEQSCRAANYPGFATIQLPLGLDEKARVRTYRQ